MVLIPQPILIAVSASDWIKIAATALAGFTAGAILEPIKHWITRRQIIRDARNEIYREFARLYMSFCEPLETEKDRPTEAREYYFQVAFQYSGRERGPYEIYNYKTKYPEYCYKIKDWYGIENTNDMFNAIWQVVADRKYSAIGAAETIKNEFEHRFAAGDLDKAKVMAYVEVERHNQGTRKKALERLYYRTPPTSAKTS